MSEWTYKRGRWFESPHYPDTPRTALAKDRLSKWDLQKRWLKFPQLGPVPEKWMDVGAPPESVEYVGEVMTAYYTEPVWAMLNEPSVLMKYLEDK